MYEDLDATALSVPKSGQPAFSLSPPPLYSLSPYSELYKFILASKRGIQDIKYTNLKVGGRWGGEVVYKCSFSTAII